jgi:sulfur relay (sulfurtransferase) DsrF/TusC family protein
VKQLILDEHISSVKKLQVPAAIQMMNKMVSYDLFILFGTNKCWVENRYREKKRKRKKEDRQVLISEDIRARMSRWCKERGSLTCMVSCLGGVVRLA